MGFHFEFDLTHPCVTALVVGWFVSFLFVYGMAWYIHTIAVSGVAVFVTDPTFYRARSNGLYLVQGLFFLSISRRQGVPSMYVTRPSSAWYV